MFNLLMGLLALTLPHALQEPPVAKQVSETNIRHGVLGLGADTFVMSGDGKTIWTYPRNTRDGWMLANGHLLLVITKSAEYPGGGVVEIDREGKTYFEYKGTQNEVDTVQPLSKNRILLTESGAKPRILEMDRSGKILFELPLQCQSENHHMQTRMARKIKNGNYLVPHAFDKKVREYSPDGKIVWEVSTPDWPFFAFRKPNGNTLITCTRGNLVREVDKEGKTVWELTNNDLPGSPIRDACGANILSNGNIVVTSYGAGGTGAVKLFEVNAEKKLLWTLYTGRDHGLHEFQILDEEGNPLKSGRVQK